MYTPTPLLCGPCGDYRCSQYGCVKKMMVDTPLNPVQAQPNITQPYNTNHVAALEMIVKLAGENAVLLKENEKLRAAIEMALECIEDVDVIGARQTLAKALGEKE